ncbi:hypothetical protein H8356DRAFT_1395018 [Neocallimastix lanati (nom. inval.)]|nr:hypothetical protein H8356DRAFT_1395018 [Neocallimastix sp. JGI-2020a]
MGVKVILLIQVVVNGMDVKINITFLMQNEITEPGYYLNQNELNESSNELFKCINEGNCSLITDSPVDLNEYNFYIDGASKNAGNKYNKLIKCEENNVIHQSRGSNGDGNNAEFICKIIDNSASNTVDHYISMEEEKDSVITCTIQGCYIEENISGYFINTNSGNSEGKIIVCEKENEYCDIVEDDNIRFGAGDIIVKTEKDESKKAYLYTSDSEDEKDIIEIKSNAENSSIFQLL